MAMALPSFVDSQPPENVNESRGSTSDGCDGCNSTHLEEPTNRRSNAKRAKAGPNETVRPEVRIARNGKAYTSDEFLEFYGREDLAKFYWDAAVRVGGPEQRIDRDGKAYTFREFASYFPAEDAKARWQSAPPASAARRLVEMFLTFPSTLIGLLESQDPGILDRGESTCRSDAAEALALDILEHVWRRRQLFCADCGGKVPDANVGTDGRQLSYCLKCWDAWIGYQGSSEEETQPSEDGCSSLRTSTDSSRERHIAACETEDVEGEAAESPMVAASVSESPSRPLACRVHYDFIEVGTSDWGTLTQYCHGNGSDGSPLAAEIRSSVADDIHLGGVHCARGLAVEAVREHLQALPQVPRVTKVEAAMDECSGRAILHCVSGENILTYYGQLKYEREPDSLIDIMWYAKSLGCLGRPHPELLPMLESVGRTDLLETREVEVLSWTSLCHRYGVGSVDVVQLDCEGRDCAILRGMMAHCDREPAGWPRLIQFESNHLTELSEREATLSELRRRGYTVRQCGVSNVIVELAAGIPSRCLV